MHSYLFSLQSVSKNSTLNKMNKITLIVNVYDLLIGLIGITDIFNMQKYEVKKYATKTDLIF